MPPNPRITQVEEDDTLLSKYDGQVLNKEQHPHVDSEDQEITTDDSKTPHDREIVWRNVAIMGTLHLMGLYGGYLFLANSMWMTKLCAIALYLLSGLGITAGSHRLWSHRSYKAKFPLRVFLCIFQSMAFENHIYEWSRDHRVHHKYSETDADPHNANRGFFFSHVGWLLVKKHPDVKTKGAAVDCSDLLADPVVRFQKKYYLSLVFLFSIFLPTVVPSYLWGESLWNAYFVCAIFRLIWTWNMTWLVNSAAHMWGNRPYDKNIGPSENILTVFGAVGEGFHNYHHTFPWDYATSEYGIKANFTAKFINLMASIGQAYDLKTVSNQVVKQRMDRTGSGTPHWEWLGEPRSKKAM